MYIYIYNYTYKMHIPTVYRTYPHLCAGRGEK